jgi:hypothetical protein
VKVTKIYLRVLQKEAMSEGVEIKFFGDISKYVYYLQNEENSKTLLKDEQNV